MWAGDTQAEEPSRYSKLRKQGIESRETKVRKVHKAEYWGEENARELQWVLLTYSTV